MSTPTLKIKVTPTPKIKGKMDVRFPARVDALSPILLDKAGGNYTISLDMAEVGSGFQPLNSYLTSLSAGYKQSGTGAVIQEWQARLRKYLIVTDFGAAGDGVTNDTASINLAFQEAYASGRKLFFPAGVYMVDDATGSAGYALLNPGVSFCGEGSTSIIAPMATMPNTTDFIWIHPATGVDINSLEAADLLILPAYDGSKRGKRGIYILINGVTNFSRLHLSGLYIGPGNDVSLRTENNPGTNPHGCPSNSVIERCAFWEGVYLTYIGDSVDIKNNILRSTAGSGRRGALVYMTDASGVAGHLIFEKNNIDCDGGAISVLQGREVKVLYNNIELSAGAGSNGAVIDIDGSSGSVNGCEIRGNHIGIFGTATASKAIRLGIADDAVIDGNTLLAGITVADGIYVGSACDRTILGINTITGFTSSITDNGTGTRKIAVTSSSDRNVREKLTADRTYYVRTDGSDSNTGLANTSGAAFLTGQKAIDTTASLDLSIYSVTIQFVSGTYTDALVLKSYIGAGPVRIKGDTTTPSNVVISTTSNNCITGDGVLGPYTIGGFKLQTTTSGLGILLSNGTRVFADGKMEFGTIVGQQIAVTAGAALTVTADYTISGGGGYHIFLLTGGQIVMSGMTSTLTGTPAFTTFLFASTTSCLNAGSWTVSGSASAGTKKYEVAMNAAVNTGGLTLPGGVAGTTATGGQYA